MFIKNTQKKNITLTAHNGYVFIVRPGISAIEESAGNILLERFAPVGENGKWKGQTFIPAPSPQAAIVESTEDEWAKEGKKLAEVQRFQIQRNQIPRQSLLEIAQKRSLEIAPSLSDDEILENLNNQPVPEDVAYPVNLNKDEK